jgi:hypothetical protein
VRENGDARGRAEFWVPTAILENPKRQLYGLPDAVDPAGGAVWPIEFKSHKRPSRTDELELAFYWWLLEPWRTMRGAEPRGRLVLRQPDGSVEVVDFPIPAFRFDQLKEYVQLIRRGSSVPGPGADLQLPNLPNASTRRGARCDPAETRRDADQRYRSRTC